MDVENKNFVTATGVYDSDYQKSSAGWKIIENQKGKLELRPWTTQENDIRTTYYLQWYDLSDHAMTYMTNVAVNLLLKDKDAQSALSYAVDRINEPGFDRYYYRLNRFVELQQQHKYPKGSKCFVIYKVQNQVPYLQFDINTPLKYKNLKAWSQASVYQDIQYDTFNGLPIAKVDRGEVFSFNLARYWGAVEYKQHVFDATFSTDLNLSDMLKAREAHYQRMLQELSDVMSLGEIKLTDYYYDNQLKGCHGYNVTAAQAIDALILQAESTTQQ
ncbi:hypothetical protein ABEF89_02015 [Acinetobacter thermotolerans]|uniref:hypothetical protein n=1 Tax=Acinetobacter thermotolerans TaxID=3151487 RepID=UPI00325C0F43